MLKLFGLKCVALLPYLVALLCISAPNQPSFFCHRQQLADLPQLATAIAFGKALTPVAVGSSRNIRKQNKKDIMVEGTLAKGC